MLYSAGCRCSWKLKTKFLSFVAKSRLWHFCSDLMLSSCLVFFLTCRIAKVQSSSTQAAHLPPEDIIWDGSLETPWSLALLSLYFTHKPLLCPVNFNTVYWEVQPNTDVCWQKFYRWWQDSINSMCTTLVFVSLREILLYAPDPVSSSTAVQGLSAEAKHKNNVCISYRDLLTHIFLLRVWNRHVMWWFVK